MSSPSALDPIDFASGAGAWLAETGSAGAGEAGADMAVSLAASAGWFDMRAAGGDDCVAVLSVVSGNSMR